MKKVYQALFVLLLSLTLIWGITTLGRMTARSDDYVPFTLYSEVVGDFASLDNSGEEGTRYYDHSGREYTAEGFDSILPSFYFRQLVMDDRLPDTIQGRPVTQAMLEREGFIFVSQPASLNVHQTPLYFLLESMSKRVGLEMPEDVFRFTGEGIEFIRMADNALDEAKSDLFTRVMRAKGVTFPIKKVAGNPSTRKPYDNGYLLVDAAGRLFRLKQNVGRPFVREIPLPEGVVPEHLFVTEYATKRELGFVVDTAGALYQIRLPDYRLVKAQLPPLRLREEKLTIIGNAFYWTVIRSDAERADYSALDAETLETVGELHFDTPERETLAYYLSPLQLSFESGWYDYLHPEVGHFSPIGLIVWLLVGGGLYLLYRRRR